MRFSLPVGLALSLFLTTACSQLPKSAERKAIDPAQVFETAGGFRFSMPMSGTWYLTPDQAGLYTAGREGGLPEGYSQVAMVRHGPIHTSGGKAMTAKEMLALFKRDLKAEAESGRVEGVKGIYTERKYRGADCLVFEQTGEDSTQKGPMDLSNDGIICLHPKVPYQFIWMAISERRPVGAASDAGFSADKKAFLKSLEFAETTKDTK